jgi:hypothetical protein
MLRYARYAVAVVFALLAVGFVALWVRSYYWPDGYASTLLNSRGLGALSSQGVLFLSLTKGDGEFGTAWAISEAESESRRSVTGFRFYRKATSTYHDAVASLPHWFLVASSLALAALFAIKRTWRFSLRTILVATTLLAAILGLAVWAV